MNIQIDLHLLRQRVVRIEKEQKQLSACIKKLEKRLNCLEVQQRDDTFKLVAISYKHDRKKGELHEKR